MKLHALRLVNYRGHADLSIDFTARFNVVVGVNGSGKTSLLRAACDALSGLTQYLSLNGHHLPISESRDVRVQAIDTSGRLRFEPQFPVSIAARSEAFGTECTWTLTKTDQASSPITMGTSPGQIWSQLQDKTNASLPLVLFYRADRHWNDASPHEMVAATQRNSRFDAYVQWWNASLDASALQGWAIAKSLERVQAASETGGAFDSIQDDELAIVNSALAAAVEGIKGLRYDIRKKSLLADWNPGYGDPTPFEYLSDGQRAVIGLVSDIARRACLLNPHLGTKVAKETTGVVLIDELDMHLHPKWQRNITTGLKAAFPSIQFIAASHSPQVLGELTPEEIILLQPGTTTHPQVSYGLDSSQVLEEIMDATARTPDVERALAEVFSALERNELAEAKDKLRALSDLAPGISELGGAQALLQRKEVLGR